MTSAYYASGSLLKQKNELLTGAGAAFPRWAIEKLDLALCKESLDVGCGWGRFAVPLSQLAPDDLQMVEVDVSAGMVRTCKDTLGISGVEAAFVVADARRLPFAPRSFDIVMANHMLYEFTDVAVPIAELARVLRPGAQLLATTYSDLTRVPLIEFHRLALAALGIARPPEPRSSFSLENGEPALRRWFSSVDVNLLDERSVLTDASAIVAIYLKSGRYNDVVSDQSIDPERRSQLAEAFQRVAEATIENEGQIESRTIWAAFIAYR
jgi:SAM-dependent methyltransferase